jgi:formate hydrogenlyase subunit 3/multisubunit Na+/H+ antiporter MnhD subunit
VAPTPASAVLSGSMIKAGLIGWMTFLPLGRVALPEASAVMVGLGLSGALIAAVLGVLQANPKAVLAYSSVSQMGLITTGIGVALGAPDIWPVMQWVVLVYAAHHAVAKCLLFLSVGLKTTRPLAGLERSLFWAGTVLAALALIGAPFSSGAVAKSLLKDSVVNSGLAHADAIVLALTLAAAGTTLLMTRYLLLLRRLSFDEHHVVSPRIWAPWILLLLMAMTLTFYIVSFLWAGQFIPALKISPWWKSLWPLVVGGVLYALAGRLTGAKNAARFSLPPGDVYHGVMWVVAQITGALRGGFHRLAAMWIAKPHAALPRRRGWLVGAYAQGPRLEMALSGWLVGAAVFAVISVLTLWLAWG